MAEKKRLRVLIAGVSWPPETFLARLFRGLADNGIEVTVACAAKPDREWLAQSRQKWLWAPNWNGSVPRRLLQLAKLSGSALWRGAADFRLFAAASTGSDSVSVRLHNLHRLLPFAGRRWEVIYFPWNGAAISYSPLFDLGCPVVISCRGSQINVAPHNPRRKDLHDGLRWTFARAAAVHCVSEHIQQTAFALGLPPFKIAVIHPGVDADFFIPTENAKVQKREFGVATVGRLGWVKGHEYALLAMRRLVEKNIPLRFDIVGDGPERQRLLYSIHDMQLADHVRLHGQLPPARVREILQQSAVFVLSSLSEGVANAVLEAMACGLPVVTTDCGGMREVVTDGVEGFVVPPRDPEKMADALMKLACDPVLRQEMGARARRRILQDFTLEQQVKAFSSLLENVCTVTE